MAAWGVGMAQRIRQETGTTIEGNNAKPKWRLAPGLFMMNDLDKRKKREKKKSCGLGASLHTPQTGGHRGLSPAAAVSTS